jgi:hypothetical protein
MMTSVHLLSSITKSANSTLLSTTTHIFSKSIQISSNQSITASTHINMAAATRKDLLKKVYNMVPPMLESFHKGGESARGFPIADN